MNSIYWFRKPKTPPPPTPLEVATAELIRAQHDLLAGHSAAENANATVDVLRSRIARLRLTVQELASEPKPSSEVIDLIRQAAQ